jgi:hypothetical protein
MRIQEGRRVVATESRFPPAPTIELEEYDHGQNPAQTGKREPGKTAGVRVSDDFPDSEIPGGSDEDLPPAGDQRGPRNP